MNRTISDVDKDFDTLTRLMQDLGRRRPLRDPLATAIEATELTPPQLHAIMWLKLDEPLTMGQLAQRVGVSEKSVTGLVDRLERVGYVQRDRDASDRRVILVRLTEEGACLASELNEQFDMKVRCFLMLLEPDDRAALIRILEKLLARTVASVA